MARQAAHKSSRRGKPKRDYAAEYRRRKASGVAAGKTVQQARGHVAREHVPRRARELREEAAGGFTTYHRKQIRDFFRDQATMIRGSDPEVMAREGLKWAQSAGGWPAFVAYRDEIKALEKIKRARYKIRKRKGGRIIELNVAGGEGSRAANRVRMQKFADRWGIPDWRWLFYK